jgi:hypothetical protein
VPRGHPPGENAPGDRERGQGDGSVEHWVEVDGAWERQERVVRRRQPLRQRRDRRQARDRVASPQHDRSPGYSRRQCRHPAPSGDGVPQPRCEPRDRARERDLHRDRDTREDAPGRGGECRPALRRRFPQRPSRQQREQQGQRCQQVRVRPGHHPEQHQRIDRPQQRGPRPPRRVRSREAVEHRRDGDVADPVGQLDPECDPRHGGVPQPRREGLHDGGGGPVDRGLPPPLGWREQPDRVVPLVELLRGHHPWVVAEDDDPPVFRVVLHVDRGRWRDEHERDGGRDARGQYQARARTPAAPHRGQPRQDPGSPGCRGEPAGGLHQRWSQRVVEVEERSPRAERSDDRPVTGRAQRREHPDADDRQGHRRGGQSLPRILPWSGAISGVEQRGHGHSLIID